MTNGRTRQILKLQQLANARLRREEALLSAATQLCRRRSDLAREAEDRCAELTERANVYVGDRFLGMERVEDPANAFASIIAGASGARRSAASAELTAVRALRRHKDADRQRADVAGCCHALVRRKDQLDHLVEKVTRLEKRRAEQMGENEIAEMVCRRIY